MFKKATKDQIKIRLAISGASGSGKTFSSLAIASHLGKSIALIDTEHGSASRYADIFDFDVCELNNFHPARYIEAIAEAERASYEVIIIDSLSHAWFAELDMVDQAKNKFTAWGPVRELERKLIATIIGCNAHVIATMRSKTEWDTSQTDERGKMKPVRIGTAPIQTSGIDYEFDIFGEMNQNHILHISKSRCPELQDQSFLNPGAELASLLLSWIKPWHNWKSEEDAIAWGLKQLPGIPREELEAEFARLNPTNGKKAPAWVAKVHSLAKF